MPNEILEFSQKIRAHVVSMSSRAGTAHLGSAMSCADILAAVYFGGVLNLNPSFPNDPGRDRFIFSKGHAIAALYAALAIKGYFEESLLETYNVDGGSLPEQPSPGGAPGVEVATGSLGHGLSLGLGMALASRINRLPYRVVVLMSDGECNEGSVWEGALAGPANGLTNVTVIVDYNKWQATGRSNQILGLSPLREKWEAFGWEAVEADGHDIPQLIQLVRQGAPPREKPLCIVAHTVKGKGVSFMEDDNNWHYRSPKPAELEQALQELGVQ